LTIANFLTSAQNGFDFLYYKKNTKLLAGINIKTFETRSPIKGHRILFRYGWQFDNAFNLNKNDVVLCRYVDDHDEISKVANSININKIYYFNQNEDYLIPVLDKNQETILQESGQYIFVNGIAGSGKTNLCIQKILTEASNGKKVVYSTFSQGLLQSTKDVIDKNYLTTISQIKNKTELSEEDLIQLNNLNSTNLEELYKNLSSIKYEFLSDVVDNKKIVVNLKEFMELNFSDKVFTFDLKNRLKDSGISVEILFKEIEGIILGLAKDSEIITFSEYEEERKDCFDKKTLLLIYSVAQKYLEFISASNKFTDKNLIALSVIRDKSLENIYDQAVLDEVQDFTQKELLAFKHIAKDVFAVGDPLQMINPSYFSFNRLKQLYGQNHKEYNLDLNYRNTNKLNTAINSLLEINQQLLATTLIY
jgi:hypothetical protein